MVWGVDDVSHEIVGSKFYYRSARQGKEELENWLHHQMSENASFEFRELDVESTDPDVKPLHVTVLMVAAAIGHAVEFEKIAWRRIGGGLVAYLTTPQRRPRKSAEVGARERSGSSSFHFCPSGVASVHKYTLG